MTSATRAWSQRFFDRVHLMPAMSHTSVYGSVLHYLKGVQAAAGTDDAGQVMGAMRAIPIHDAFIESATLRADGRVMRPMYLARVKTPAASKGLWDCEEILKTRARRGRVPSGERVGLPNNADVSASSAAAGAAVAGKRRYWVYVLLFLLVF